MNVALIVISDRADLYRPRMEASLACVLEPFAQRITVDDLHHHLGLSGAVQAAWDQIGDDIDYVMHLEEDYVLLETPPLAEMCATLEKNENLAQLVLQRQFEVNNPGEFAAGSVISANLGEIVEHDGWIEHHTGFSLNPCVYPVRITRYGWPAGGGEREFTEKLAPDGWVYGFWGQRSQSPAVQHIGALRAPGWRI